MSAKTYKPVQIVSMSEPLKVLEIKQSDLVALFERINAPENLTLIKDSLNQQDISG